MKINSLQDEVKYWKEAFMKEKKSQEGYGKEHSESIMFEENQSLQMKLNQNQFEIDQLKNSSSLQVEQTQRLKNLLQINEEKYLKKLKESEEKCMALSSELERVSSKLKGKDFELDSVKESIIDNKQGGFKEYEFKNIPKAFSIPLNKSSHEMDSKIEEIANEKNFWQKKYYEELEKNVHSKKNYPSEFGQISDKENKLIELEEDNKMLAMEIGRLNDYIAKTNEEKKEENSQSEEEGEFEKKK